MKDIVPKDRREQALVQLGKKQQRAADKVKAKNDEVDELKKKNRALAREKNAAVEEAEPMHRLALGGGVIVGAGAGIAGQHYVVDKYAANKYVRRGSLPLLGLLVAGAGAFVDGGAGDGMVGFGLGLAVGSGGTSAAKYLTE